MLRNRLACCRFGSGEGLGGGERGRRVRQGWPEQWNNILIYPRSEQWLVCFWSTLSWMTPKQRGKEQSHLQLLVTNMAVIRQWWPSQDCRPTRSLCLPSPRHKHAHKHRPCTSANMQYAAPNVPLCDGLTSLPADPVPFVSSHSEWVKMWAIRVFFTIWKTLKCVTIIYLRNHQ